MPDTFEAEFTQVFDNVGVVLRAAGLDYGDILEMTSYHVDMAVHLDVFRQVKDRYLVEPWPAWSAIGTTELATDGPSVEIRVICRDMSDVHPDGGERTAVTSHLDGVAADSGRDHRQRTHGAPDRTHR